MTLLSKFVGKNFETWGGTASLTLPYTSIEIDFNSKSNVFFSDGPSNDSVLRIVNFPIFVGFEKKIMTYTVAISQGAIARSVVRFELSGTDGSTRAWGVGGDAIKWLDGTTGTATANSLDFFNFILLNTGVSGTNNGGNLNQYELFANLNGPYM